MGFRESVRRNTPDVAFAALLVGDILLAFGSTLVEGMVLLPLFLVAEILVAFLVIR